MNEIWKQKPMPTWEEVRAALPASEYAEENYVLEHFKCCLVSFNADGEMKEVVEEMVQRYPRLFLGIHDEKEMEMYRQEALLLFKRNEVCAFGM